VENSGVDQFVESLRECRTTNIFERALDRSVPFGTERATKPIPRHRDRLTMPSRRHLPATLGSAVAFTGCVTDDSPENMGSPTNSPESSTPTHSPTETPTSSSNSPTPETAASWSYDASSAVTTAPALTSENVITGTKAGSVHAVDRETDKVTWTGDSS
jgi:glucose dehydrogenase